MESDFIVSANDGKGIICTGKKEVPAHEKPANWCDGNALTQCSASSFVSRSLISRACTFNRELSSLGAQAASANERINFLFKYSIGKIPLGTVLLGRVEISRDISCGKVLRIGSMRDPPCISEH